MGKRNGNATVEKIRYKSAEYQAATVQKVWGGGNSAKGVGRQQQCNRCDVGRCFCSGDGSSFAGISASPSNTLLSNIPSWGGGMRPLSSGAMRLLL